jgi:hypothetical protein
MIDILWDKKSLNCSLGTGDILWGRLGFPALPQPFLPPNVAIRQDHVATGEGATMH